MKHKSIAVASITILLCMVLGNIIACLPAPTIEYALLINSTEGGSVTTPGEGIFTYDEGTVVNLAAVAEEYYPFHNWTGDVDTIADVNAATTSITMLDNYAITANFAQSPVKTYSNYGFSFEYPKDFSVTEMGMWESEANAVSGGVQVWGGNGEFELFLVGWRTIMSDEIESWPGGLEGFLKDDIEEGFAVIESAGDIASFEKGELVEATKAGHLIFYQYYAVTFTVGEKAYGVRSSFYCDVSAKVFSLMLLNNTSSTEEDGIGDFQNYLDSFVCH